MLRKASDEDLVEQAKGGDRTAFADLLTRHYDLIFRLSFRLLGSEAEAEDLAQDICAELALKLKNFRGESKFTTWLHSLTVNKARDQIRKNTTRSKAAAGWGDVEVLKRQEAHEAKADLEWLQQAMQDLPQDLQETVALVLGEEMTHKQAADVLGLSEGTVSWRMNAVRKALKDRAKAEERL